MPRQNQPVGLPNPRLKECCDLHPAGGRVCNFCYQNAVLQCLASLPWERRMLPTGKLQANFWDVMRVLTGTDGQKARSAVPDFIVGRGIELDEQFKEGAFRNCHGQVAIRQCDAGEYFIQLIDEMFRSDESRSPFNFVMDVQHFETRDIGLYGVEQLDSKFVMSAKETHSLLIVEPVSKDLNDCISASYDERHVVKETKAHKLRQYTRYRIRDVVKQKQATIMAPAPRFLGVYIKRIVSRSTTTQRNAGDSHNKDTRIVEIPLDSFHLERKSSFNYHCVGIVCHAGQSIHSGHYVAYVRRGRNWFLCDDANITLVSAHDSNGMFQPLNGRDHVPYIAMFCSDGSDTLSSAGPETLQAEISDGNERNHVPTTGVTLAVAGSTSRVGTPRPQPCRKCAQLTKELSDLKVQVLQAEESRDRFGREARSLRDELPLFQESVEEKDREIEHLKHQVEDMRESYASEVRDLRHQVSHLRELFSESQHNKALAEQSNQTLQEHVRILEKRFQDIDRVRAADKKKMQAQKKKHKELLTTQDALHREVSKYRRMAADSQRWQSRFEKLAAENQELQTAVDRLSQSLVQSRHARHHESKLQRHELMPPGVNSRVRDPVDYTSSGFAVGVHRPNLASRGAMRYSTDTRRHERQNAWR